MGGSVWNDDVYRDREQVRARSGTDAFNYHRDVQAGRVARQTHDLMNPKGVTRESRDSEAHPESLAIGVMLDVTGSMATLPKQIQQRLPRLMNATQEHVKDPHILFGAVGDSVSDRAPLQVGQFEAGIETDDDLGRMYLEGNGGGSGEESYQNAVYFFARHTSCDCWEKRQRKGYLFIIGDERNYPTVNRRDLQELFGDPAEADIPTTEVFKEAMEKWHIFFMIPQGASHAREQRLYDHWAELIGPERVIRLDDVDSVSEVIATTIGITERSIDLGQAQDNLAQGEGGSRTATHVTSALSDYAASVGAMGNVTTPRNVRI